MSDSASAGLESRSREDLLRVCVGKIGDGNQDALATIYDQTSTLVYSIALGMLADRADAEEVTLDVYSQIWRTASGFRPDRGTVIAWLVMIARSRAVDRLRLRRRRLEQEADNLETSIGDKPAAIPSPEQTSIVKEEMDRVRAALSALPANQRDLIELACYRGFTHSELAEKTGLPLGTVKTRMRQGLAKLRELLSAIGGSAQ